VQTVKEIDAKIEHYRRVAERITDQNTIAGIRRGLFWFRTAI
jgi:hypothetical protein